MASKNLLPFETIKRDIILRKEFKTSQKHGCYPDKRKIEDLLDYSIVNINKPKGPTSHQVAAYARDILKVKKTGHAGTLDPKVTGVLPIAIGKATRIVQALLPAGKEYVAIMHLHKEIETSELMKVINEFVGKIKQLPPIKSAVKRQIRERKIYYIDVIEIKDQDVLFRVGCQGGTYIRKLCHDIGKKLGIGAHMAELVRTKAGPFGTDTMVTLQDLQDALAFYEEENNEKWLRKILQPVESAVRHFPKVWAADPAVDSLCHGANLAVPGISKLESGILKGDTVAVMTLKDELIAIGEAKLTSEEMTAKKGIAVDTKKVFMEPGTYPKMS